MHISFRYTHSGLIILKTVMKILVGFWLYSVLWRAIDAQSQGPFGPGFSPGGKINEFFFS